MSDQNSKPYDGLHLAPTLKKSPLVLWIMVAVVVITFITLLNEMIAPFITGIVIAYLLNPVVTRVSGQKVPRWLSSLLIMALFFIVMAILFALFMPVFVQEVQALSIKLYEQWAHFTSGSSELSRRLRETVPFEIPAWKELANFDFIEPAGSLSKGIIGSVKGAMIQLFTSSMAFFDLVSFLIVVPVVSFYCMRDWLKLRDGFYGLVPHKHRDTAHELMTGFDNSLSGFVRGQGLVALILGTYYAVALSIMNLNFAIAIGFISGLLSFIPYVGSSIGFLLSVGIAYFQFDSMLMPVIAAAIFMSGQSLEGVFLSPKIIGDRVGLHPVWVIFSLMAGGNLLGLTGMLLAVPVAALIGVLVRFIVKRYKSSEYYQST